MVPDVYKRQAFDGVVNDPMKMGGVDLRLKFSGDSLGDLYELTGVLLPDTPDDVRLPRSSIPFPLRADNVR